MQKNNILNTFTTNVFIQICTVLQGVLLARLLGPTGRGEFLTIMLYPTIFAGIGILGFNMAIARSAAQGEDTKQLKKIAILLSFITGSIAGITCALALPFMLPEDKKYLLFMAIIFIPFIPLNHFGLNLMAIDLGTGNFTRLNITRAILYPIFFIGLIFSWIYNKDEVLCVVISLIIANTIVVVIRIVGKSTKNNVVIVEKPKISRLIKSAFPFAIASIIEIIYSQLDKLLLIFLLSPSEIGWYVAAFAAAGTIKLFSNALGIVQFTTSAQTAQRDGFENLAKLLRRSLVLTIFSALILTAILPTLIPLVYGNDFSRSTSIATLLIPGLILSGLGEIVDQSLRGQGRPLATMFSRLLGLSFMVILATALHDNLGGESIAIGYSIGELITTVGMLIIIKKHYKNSNLLKIIPKPLDVAYIYSAIKIKIMR